MKAIAAPLVSATILAFCSGVSAAIVESLMTRSSGVNPQSDADAPRRRDEVVKHMLSTPPQPKASPKKKKTAFSAAGAPGAKPET